MVQAGPLGYLGCTEWVAVSGLHRWICWQGCAVLLGSSHLLLGGWS